jgi:hypothetical protein
MQTIRLTTMYFVVAMAALLIGSTRAYAKSQLFVVSCDFMKFVADWETGSNDPGKEQLRTVTRIKNPGCSVIDYNAVNDSMLPRRTYTDWRIVPFPSEFHLFR